MVVRSKAPLRFNFAGGGTDLEPYKNENGGLVLSATIDKYAYGSLIVRQDRNIVVQSLDYDFMAKYHLDDEMPFEGELDLAKAVIDGLKADFKYGFDFFIHSDAPPGSGLGSSSALVVALIGLIKHLQRIPLTSREIAELAYQIERTDLGIEGGMHDQFSAVFGGFNSIEFSKSAAIVDPLRVEPEIVNELEYNLLLCYTGRTRISAKIICTQVQACERKVPEVLKALDESKEIAVALRKALLQGRLNEFGRLLHTAWTIKKQIAEQITTPIIDKLYAAACESGAMGGTLLGAGGGGYLLLYCEFGKKHLVAEALEKLGGQVVEFTFEQRGLQTWATRD